VVAWCFALGAVALLGVTGLGRVVRAPPALLAAAVTFLPYLYAAWLAVGFFVWTLLPDRKLPPVAMGALLVAGAGLWGPSWGARAALTDGEPVRLVRWNLRGLWGGPADGGDPRACVVEALRAERPDVLTLMEVSADNVAWLQQQLGMQCVHHPYRSTGSSQHGGLAICSRGDRWHLGRGGGLRFVDAEDWYYVASEVQGPGDVVFNVLAVHLTPYDYAAKRLRSGVQELARGQADTLADLSRSGQATFQGQSDQAAALLDRVDRLRDPTVVAGDFNSTRDAALHGRLRQQLVDTWERGGMGFGGTIDFADALPLRIDYVYASTDFGVVGAQVPASGCSDHRPVAVDLVLPRQR
jgi:endonuclease/exonuclease/phosphatase (EEP) superfamily protein YafD